MSGLTFTEDAARQLARVYLTPDVVAQRAETMKRLALSPGVPYRLDLPLRISSRIARLCATLFRLT